jgi:hypothetical protein
MVLDSYLYCIMWDTLIREKLFGLLSVCESEEIVQNRRSTAKLKTSGMDSVILFYPTVHWKSSRQLFACTNSTKFLMH